MTQHLEKNSGTLLPIALSCLFFLFMAASALTSIPSADAATPAADDVAVQATVESPADEPTAVSLLPPTDADTAALPVAMLMEPTPSEHQVSYLNTASQHVGLA